MEKVQLCFGHVSSAPLPRNFILKVKHYCRLIIKYIITYILKIIIKFRHNLSKYF